MRPAVGLVFMQVNKIIFTTLLFLISLGFAKAIWAQSTDQALPTPILANDITGKISALDVGDPRATRHFYAFAASPGDLLITVESRNLNGDIDVFTAITFRPLMKTTVLSSSQSASVTKGIYLRAHQILILRVEARTPNDDPGTYHIRFGGTFATFSGGIPVAENTETPAESTPTSGGRRVTSVGATIPEPVKEKPAVAEAPPQPTPEATEKPADTAPAKTTTAKSRRAPTPRTTSRRRTPPPANKPDAGASKTDSPTTTASDVPKSENPSSGVTGEVKTRSNEKAT